MRPENIHKLRTKISALAEELARLEDDRDRAVSRGRGASAADKERVKNIVAAFQAIRQAERRLHVAKRLLARAQGDEYEYAKVS